MNEGKNLRTISRIGRMLRGEIPDEGIRPCRLVNILGLCLVKYGTPDSTAAEKEMCSALTHPKKCVQHIALRYLTLLRTESQPSSETLQVLKAFENNPKNHDNRLTPEEKKVLT